MVDDIQNPYQNEEYRQQRKASLDIIPKSSFLNAIKNNAGTLIFLLASAVTGAVVSGVVRIPIWGTVALAGAALAIAGINAYAGYMDDKMSRITNLGYGEARQIADARVNAKEMAAAFKEALGEDLKNVEAANQQTQQTVAALQQKISSWQEREIVKEETPRTLQ